MSTVLSCPFCGSDGMHCPDGDLEGYTILCSGNRDPEHKCKSANFGYAAPADAIQAWNTRSGIEPMEMWLCESQSFVLRVGQPYIFKVNPECESCRKLADQAREAYGPSMGAPDAVTDMQRSERALASLKTAPELLAQIERATALAGKDEATE